jgi:hypothetical protein
LVEEDLEFAQEVELAREAGIDAIEDALHEAATEGWLEVDEEIKNGQVVRRVERHRKDRRLLTRLREWRRPPIQVQAHVDYQSLSVPPENRPVTGLADVVRLAVQEGQAHLLGLGLERLGIDVNDLIVDAEVEELPTHELRPGAAASTGDDLP